MDLHELLDLVGIPDPAIESSRFVRSLTRGDRPTFDYGHIMLPHQPFRYFSTFQFHRPLVETVFDGANFPAWNGEGDAAIARELHILQLQAADTVLGQVRARLERIGAWDDSVVVATADEDESDADHDACAHRRVIAAHVRARTRTAPG